MKVKKATNEKVKITMAKKVSMVKAEGTVDSEGNKEVMKKVKMKITE